MKKYSRSAILMVLGCLTAYGLALAAEPAVPEPFKRFDDNSKYTINYDDLSDLLGRVVVDVGISERKIVDPPAPKTGTRMKPKVKRYTEGEGNRFFYEAFADNEAGREYLRNIKQSLEQLPTEIPLERFSRDEQLAYWLNLYNVTVLNEIIDVYPQRSLQKLFRGKDSMLRQKLLTVSGIPLSLDDIQFTILKENYNNNPLIIYGLYQGIVGGPNIRKSAYTGNDVYRALEENAYEFINSNRGTFSNDENIFMVSNLYDRSRAFFPEFDSDLAEHLLTYLEGNERERLLVATTLDPSISDWTVTDLGGTRHEVGGSFAYNHAALLDAYQGRRRANGGILVAGVEVVRDKKVHDKDAEDAAAIEEMGQTPVDMGADPEEIVTGEKVPVE
jgi:hypothetical protein